MTAPASPSLALPLPLLLQARTRPEHPALIVRGRLYGYLEVSALADLVAGQLAAAGLRSGDRLALLLPDGLRFVASLHAAARLGAVLVPLNSRLTRAELQWQLADAEPALVVAECAWAERVAGRARILHFPAIDESSRAFDSADRLDTGLPGLEGLAPASRAELLDRLPLDAAQAILYTSGTTGRPKGAVLTVGNLLWSALGSALRLGSLPEDRWLAPLPLFHVGGLALLWRSALNGSTAVLPGRFDAAEIARSLDEDGITLVSMVPTMLARLLEIRGDRPAPAALRVLLLGGGPTPEPLLARALALGYPVARTYGLSEAASQVATAAPGDARAGAPGLPFVELRIADAAGDILASGEAGEIQVRGPMVMAGYWRAPEATAAALRGGWLHTGDVGSLDAAGRLHVGGRRADLIVSGGENVYPAEVEAALLGHPAVAECCVLGLPDEVWGQRVVAVVVARTPEVGEVKAAARAGEDPAIEASAEASTAALSAELDTFLRERLAAYKLPRGYTFLSELPRTASGKTRREALLAEFVSLDPPA